MLLVPTNAWDLVEFAALRRALARGRVEPRPSISLPLDVLAQHLVTLALAGGLDPEQAWTEARGTAAFAALRREDFDALLGMLERGGSALARYPEFARLRADGDGRWRPASRAVARDHRLAIGTLLGDELIPVRSPAGRALGELEERFLARLRPGEAFRLGGEVYRLLALREDHAVARPARRERAVVPRWLGGRMALTPELGETMLEVLAGGDEPELALAAPLLAEQARGSACPRPGELLVELIEAEGERVLCLYPFAGRELHAGLAALLGVRLGLLAVGPLAFAADERGLLLGLAGAWPEAERLRAALAAEPLAEELAAAVDLSTLERRRFHAVAQIAGLVPRARGGARRSARHLRLSTALLYEVLRRHDPEHPMLGQARRETLEEELALRRLAALCARLREQPLRICRPPRPTPLAAPLLSERLRAVLGPDRLEDRARRLAAALGAGDG
ncbi:MAG: hypothetical protein RML12_06925 [Xanthomonadales bacterium]|nr:hypothetical protein [Xanthomonadales bacterium]